MLLPGHEEIFCSYSTKSHLCVPLCQQRFSLGDDVRWLRKRQHRGMGTVWGQRCPLLWGPTGCPLPLLAPAQPQCQGCHLSKGPGRSRSTPCPRPQQLSSKAELNSPEKPAPAAGMCFISGQLTQGDSRQSPHFWAGSDLFTQGQLPVSPGPAQHRARGTMGAQRWGCSGPARLDHTLPLTQALQSPVRGQAQHVTAAGAGRQRPRSGWAGRKRWVPSEAQEAAAREGTRHGGAARKADVRSASSSPQQKLQRLQSGASLPGAQAAQLPIPWPAMGLPHRGDSDRAQCSPGQSRDPARLLLPSTAASTAGAQLGYQCLGKNRAVLRP